MEKYIVTNFAYGTGPYLRTSELVIALNDELERRGEKRMSAIVPLVYGERQKTVLLEEFGEHLKKYPHELLLDAKLGALLGSVFYANSTYEEALKKWVETADSVGAEINAHLSGVIEVETLAGEKLEVNGKNIALELNRSPRISFGIKPSYSTTFGYIADILEKAQGEGRKNIDVDPELLKKGVALADKIEGNQTLSTMAYPGTFTWDAKYQDRYGATLVPPITNLPKANDEDIAPGIFVTITGIPGLERLYQEARELGLKLYSNDTKAVAGSEWKLPHVIPNKNIIFQFARSGWGSIWLSMFCGTPIVVPEFDPKDDPEIYFNNIAVEKLGIGIVYRGQPLKDILAEAPRLRENCVRMREDILNRFGTLNGNEACAKLIADHFLR